MTGRSIRVVHALLVVVFLVAPIRGAFAGSRMAMIVAPGDTAPEIAVPALEGWKFHSDWSQATYTVLNFWATWCEPCKTEIPVLQGLQTRYKDRGLAVIGGMIEGTKDDDARAFLASLGVTYRVIRIDSDTANNWGGVNVLPTTYVIDKKGRVLKRYVGATPEQVERMKSDIEGLFPEPAKKP